MNTDNRSKALEILIGLQSIRCPVRFEFLHKPFVVEIQYFLRIESQSFLDMTKSMLAFAVTADGHELLIDLETAHNPIFQNESGEVDFIDITIFDLQEATISCLMP